MTYNDLHEINLHLGHRIDECSMIKAERAIASEALVAENSGLT